MLFCYAFLYSCTVVHTVLKYYLNINIVLLYGCNVLAMHTVINIIIIIIISLIIMLIIIITIITLIITITIIFIIIAINMLLLLLYC